MIDRPQVQRDLREIENHLRFTRNRLTYYETMDDSELAAHTGRVVAGLEGTKQALLSRIQELPDAKV